MNRSMASWVWSIAFSDGWLNGRLFRSAGTVIFANGIGASFWVLFERLVGRALSLRCRSKATPHGDLSADRSIFFVVCL